MALIIKEVSSNTVTEVGNVIIIEGGGLTPAQSAKLDNVPSDTNAELANKVDKSGTKVLSDVNYTVGDKSKVDNVPANTNSSISAINSSISTINTNLTGKADLDPDTNKLSLEQLPEGYNNVVEAANLAAFPGTGVANTIYVALDTNLTYRWSGTQYTEVSQSLALGETSASAYRGDRGATAYTHSQSTGNPHGLALSDISTNLEDKSSAQIRAEITESDIPVEIARTTAIPTTTTPLTDTSAKRFVTDTEKATWNNKADTGDFAAAISITGTHVETTTAIDFSTNQGYAITLTADRTLTVSTGLSASNPVGLLKVTHNGHTPTFSDVDVVLDSPLDKSGVYYLRFTRQADGTITQSNQSGGSGATTFDELTDITTTASSVNKIDLILGLYIPDAPTIMTSLSGQDISVTITPGSDNGFTITGYKVEVNSGSGWATVVASTSENPYLIEAPGEGTHQVRVSSINAIGTSAASNIDSETIAGSTVDIILNLANSGVGEVSSPDANGLYCNNLNLAGDWTTLRELLTAGNVVNVNGDTVAGVSVHLTSAVIDAGTNGDKLTNEGSIMTPQYFNHVWESRLTQGSFAIEVRGLSAGASFTAIGSGGYANSNNTTSRLVMNSTNGTTWEPNGADVSTFSTVTANSDGSGVLNIQGDNVNNDGRTPVGAIRITAN